MFIYLEKLFGSHTELEFLKPWYAGCSKSIKLRDIMNDARIKAKCYSKTQKNKTIYIPMLKYY